MAEGGSEMELSRYARAAIACSMIAAAACGGTGGAGRDVEVSDGRGSGGELVETGGDGAGVGGDPCDFETLEAEDAVEAPAGAWKVGEFSVAVRADGSMAVEHADEPGRVLFETPAGRVLVGAVGKLELEEAQGSFQVEESGTARCDGAVEHVREDGLRLELAGELDGACDGQRFTVRFCQPLEHHLRFEVSLDEGNADCIFVQSRAEAAEHFFGMGEQFTHDTLDLKGRVIPVIVQAGGIGRGEEKVSPVAEALSPGASGSEESTYYPVPHYITSESRSLFLEGDGVSVFDFSQEGLVEVRGYERSLTGRVVHGTGPLELVERFTEYSGRMSPLPEWTGSGAIVALARDLPESLAIVSELAAHGVKIAGVWNQGWCGKVQTIVGEQVLWNWARNEEANPGWSAFVDAVEDEVGARILCYVNPMFRDPPEDVAVERDLFDEGIAGGYFVRNGAGEVYLQPVTAFDVALLDLSSEAARSWMKDVIRTEMVEKAGCSGWMADFGEALPMDAVMASGETGAQWHNRYPVEWARLNREALQEAGLEGEALVFHRSGFTTSPSQALLVWEGDQLTTWDRFDGIESALHGLISGGFSGIALNHSDVGGYTSLPLLGKEYLRNEELLLRWAEMNAFGPVLRTHEGNAPGMSMQVYGSESAMDGFARMTQLYAALASYRQGLFEEAHARGWPMVRHLAMHYPDDEESWAVNDEFLLGAELLVAPMLEPCADQACQRAVYLPPGPWTHVWTGEQLGAAGEGEWVSVPAPLGEPAVFVKTGSRSEESVAEAFAEAGLFPLE